MELKIAIKGRVDNTCYFIQNYRCYLIPKITDVIETQVIQNMCYPVQGCYVTVVIITKVIIT